MPLMKTKNESALGIKLNRTIQGLTKLMQTNLIVDLAKLGIGQNNIARTVGVNVGFVNKALKKIYKKISDDIKQDSKSRKEIHEIIKKIHKAIKKT
jgi:hypothetical protein